VPPRPNCHRPPLLPSQFWPAPALPPGPPGPAPPRPPARAAVVPAFGRRRVAAAAAAAAGLRGPRARGAPPVQRTPPFLSAAAAAAAAAAANVNVRFGRAIPARTGWPVLSKRGAANGWPVITESAPERRYAGRTYPLEAGSGRSSRSLQRAAAHTRTTPGLIRSWRWHRSRP
jgi:hypothetical protein